MKMKKTIALLLVLVMLFALVACGTTTEETVVTEETTITEDVSTTEVKAEETIKKDIAESSQFENNEIAIGTWKSFCARGEGYSATFSFYGISLTVNEDATYTMEYENSVTKGDVTDVSNVTKDGKVVQRLYTLDDTFLFGVIIEKTGDERVDGEAVLFSDGNTFGMQRAN